jgi:hypothetical protein
MAIQHQIENHQFGELDVSPSLTAPMLDFRIQCLKETSLEKLSLSEICDSPWQFNIKLKTTSLGSLISLHV